MNKKILSALISAAAIGFATYGVNIKAATDTGNAAANIVTAITIAETTGMNFGNISVGAGGGTATLGTGDSITSVTGDVVAEVGGTVTSADFGLSGANVGYTITMPGSITVSGPGTDMTIDTFTFLAEDAATDGTGTMSGNAGTMTIGGRLAVSGSQTGGAYSGTYTITALYE